MYNTLGFEEALSERERKKVGNKIESSQIDMLNWMGSSTRKYETENFTFVRS